MTAVNNSVPYDSVPFYFERTACVAFLKRDYYANTLRSVLDQSGFFEARGVTLYLNFISPVVSFTDKAKTKIIADKFQDALFGVIEYLCRDIIKEVERARRARQRFDRDRLGVHVKQPSKKDLVMKYFFDAFETASGGGKYLVTARQIFYVVRNILNVEHGIDLTNSDYNTFTQHHVTDIIDRYPEYEEKILFERRGFFIEPSGGEVPLGTKDVIDFISRASVDGSISPEPLKPKAYSINYGSIPIELQYNHVLFIEKAGYSAILKQSGLVDELHMGVIASQGFSTRAAKRLMAFFLNKGIRVYVLHDCDVAGYLIQSKLEDGSNTFRKALDVVEIGLTLDDVENLGKRGQAETVTYKKPYSRSLEILTPEERDFFVVRGKDKMYRRVEINTLTTPELLDFLKQKISCQPIRPTAEQLQKCIQIDDQVIIKEALFKAFEENIKFVADKDELIERVYQRVGAENNHWLDTLNKIIEEWVSEQISALTKKLK